jgi:hypothetical protein
MIDRVFANWLLTGHIRLCLAGQILTIMGKKQASNDSAMLPYGTHDTEEEAVGLAWYRQVAAAWSCTDGGPPRRAITLGSLALLRVEEILTDAHYRRRGLDTAGIDPIFKFAVETELLGYVPTRWRALRGVFRNRPITSDDVLLDYGSGKGRTIIWAAATYRFRRIIGIELDGLHHATAEANLARWRGRTLCDEVDFIQADATEYDVPDDVTIIFFGNPFFGAVFEKVAGKIQESLARNPRELTVLYYHARMHETLINAGFYLERQRSSPPNDWAIYRYPEIADRAPAAMAGQPAPDGFALPRASDMA